MKERLTRNTSELHNSPGSQSQKKTKLFVHKYPGTVSDRPGHRLVVEVAQEEVLVALPHRNLAQAPTLPAKQPP